MAGKPEVIIVGAGVAGLIAAYELEQQGIVPRILEGSSEEGGRIKTEEFNGFLLDHGFQVLLTSYPEAQRYLNFEELDLCYFESGALIYGPSGPFTVEDPLRKPSRALQALLSPVGTIGDKWRMWQLTRRLKSKTIQDIFESQSIPTKQYLKEFGFSPVMRANFLQPFFSGIFLENKLNTSSRMFEFVFKMFIEGEAAIPRKGMQMIPRHLRSKLKETRIDFNKKVGSIGEKKLTLEDGKELTFDALIIATHPSQITPDFKAPGGFQKTVNLYFSIPKMESKSFIGLFPSNGKLINNCCIISNVSSDYAPEDESLVSVSLVGIPEINEDLMVQQVIRELSKALDIQGEDIRFLKSFFIPHALPLVVEPSYKLEPDQLEFKKGVFLAGDYLMNGSLNAAMSSGRICANVVIERLNKG